MNLARLNRILELFWWAMAIVSLVAILIFCFQDGFNRWSFYFLIPVIAVIMALVRRFMRIKLEKSSKNK